MFYMLLVAGWWFHVVSEMCYFVSIFTWDDSDADLLVEPRGWWLKPRRAQQTRSLPGSRPEVMLRNALAPGPSCRCRDEAQHTEFILKSVARINQTMYEDQMVVPEWPSELEDFM